MRETTSPHALTSASPASSSAAAARKLCLSASLPGQPVRHNTTLQVPSQASTDRLVRIANSQAELQLFVERTARDGRIVQFRFERGEVTRVAPGQKPFEPRREAHREAELR